MDENDTGECTNGGDHDVPGGDDELRVCRHCGAEFFNDEDDD